MSLAEADALIRRLERNPAHKSIYRGVLERCIADLMEAVSRATGTTDKLRLTALEYRARLIRERWKLRGLN